MTSSIKVISLNLRPFNSFSPLDSDILSNLMVMDQLVGTLVKYGHDGRYHPYLAERWTVSEDKKIWNFYIRKGLIAEDSTQINAYTYKSGLIKILKLLYSVSDHSAFDELVGIDSLKSNKDSDENGINVIDDYHLQFKFKNPPNGFIEYLGQPYYGFFSENDFNIKGEWKDQNNIVSSGHYKKKDYRPGQSVVLEKRNGWFSNDVNSPDEVEFLYFENPSIDELKRFKKRSIFVSLGTKQEKLDGHITVTSTPEILSSLAFSRDASGYFSDKKHRELFRENLRRALGEIDWKERNWEFPVTKFYDLTKTDFSDFKGEFLELPPSNTVIKVAISKKVAESKGHIKKELIEKIFSTSKIKYEFVAINSSNSEEIYKLRSNKEYDIRFIDVNTCSFYENWVVEMMFCGTLGVSYPDYQKSVCHLVEKVKKTGMDSGLAMRQLNEIIEDEAYIIPITRAVTIINYSPDISTSDQSPTISTIRLDLTKVLN